MAWIVALALAIMVGLSSYVIANEVRFPVKSLAAGVPPSAIASANVALQSYALRQTENPQTTVNNLERRLALQAYQREPLSSTAAGLLAVSMGRPSDVEKRQALLEQAGKLSRRDALVSRELITSAAQRNDNGSFFRWLSRLVLTNDQSRKVYIRAMADATAKDGAVAALAPVIGEGPQWSETYWNLVAGRPASLSNAAKLRILVAGKPWGQAAILPTDPKLVESLIKQRQYDLAVQLTKTLDKQAFSGSSTANLLANGGLYRQPKMPPLDWKLATSGNLGATIDEKNHVLLISAIGGARGAAAHQLLRLSPGRYALKWSLSSDNPAEAGALAASLQCADGTANSPAPPPVPLVAGKREVDLLLVPTTCEWYWFSILVTVPDDSAGFDVRLREMSLVARKS
ncbi:hypothetical protein [Sphingopyxis panaciterrae]